MEPFQILDTRFANCINLEIGSCTSVALADILSALGLQDTAAAVTTFKAWAQSRGLMAVQLTLFAMMVGRQLGQAGQI